MEKDQNITNRNQDNTDNGANQKQNEDLNKKVIDPNNPVANKDQYPGNQNQNIDLKVDQGSNQKQNEDLNKKITDPNNPVANKDKQPVNQMDSSNPDKPKSGISNKSSREEEEEEDNMLVDKGDSDERDQSRNPNQKK
jgi:hypothetical protein